MILDAELLFSNAQSVTATADSTNTVDLGEGAGRNLNPRQRVFAQVVAAPTGATSLKAELKGSNDGSSWTTIADGGTVLAANLVAGAQLLPDIPYLAGVAYRYLKVAYTVAGTVTVAAKITAGIIEDGVPAIDLEH